MRTQDECKRILSKIGFSLGVSPRIISTKLMDSDDKKDLMSGKLTVESLHTAVKTWIENGMQDMVNR
jgi:hypothetical protein